MKYEKAHRVWLKNNTVFNEKWLQQRIADDPVLLGLGKLILRDKERIQPRAGRLDLLLQDEEGKTRYVTEIQLGASDESHIIRTIEYWDIERTRFPQYDHVAVIAAEDITSRFLNVISLLNKSVPLIAVQIYALETTAGISLVCTKVLDLATPALEEEDESVETANREYWTTKGGKESVALVDELLKVIRTFDPEVDLKYNKFYIGLAKHDVARNYVIFRPKKLFLQFEPRLPRTDITDAKLETAGVEVLEYEERWHRYRIRLTKKDLVTHEALVGELIKAAFDGSNG